MMIKTTLLVSILVLSITTIPVKYEISFQEKYKSSEEEPPREIDATYNGMPIMRTQYLMNRVKVTAVIIDEQEPSTSNVISVFPEYDLRSSNPEDNTEFEGMTDEELPAFEVEYGREPLEYLMNMLKIKYGMDVVPNSMIGMANQYGFSLKSEGLSAYPGSKMSDYNMDADSVDSLLGPLIGVYQSSTTEEPNELEQTKEESEYKWEEKMGEMPVTTIIYLLNINKENLETEEFARYGKTFNLKENANEILANMDKTDMNYTLSRVIFTENAFKHSDVFGVRSSPEKFLV